MESDAEQLFRRLLEPVSAIGDLFNVNLSTILDPFLDHLEDVLCKIKMNKNGVESKEIDFVRAGYLISNATLLLGVRVDTLYKQVNDFIDVLKVGGNQDGADNDDGDNIDMEIERKLDNNKNPFTLLPIDGLKAGGKSARFCEYDPTDVDIFPKTQAAFMAINENEKRRVNLYSIHNKTHVVGCKDDFLVNTCSFLQNGIAILDFDFMDIINIIEPPRSIIMIDELPETNLVTSQGETQPSQACMNPIALRDKLVRDLEKEFHNISGDDGIGMDYDGVEMPDQVSNFVDEIRAGSAATHVLPSDVLNDITNSKICNMESSFRINSTQTDHTSEMEGIVENYQNFLNVSTNMDKTAIEINEDEVIKASRKSRKHVMAEVDLADVAEKVKEHVETHEYDDIDQIKCRSKDAMDTDYLPSKKGCKQMEMVIPCEIGAKYLDFNKLIRQRERAVKRALHKDGDGGDQLTFSQVMDYFDLNKKNKINNAALDSCIYDEDKLYEVCLADRKRAIKSLRNKVVMECEKNMIAATNVPEAIVECLEAVSEQDEDFHAINDEINNDDVDPDIPSFNDLDMGTLPVYDNILTDADINSVEAFHGEHDTSKKGKKRQAMEDGEEFSGTNNDIGFSKFNTTIFIQQDEELPNLTYAEIIEKYNEKYWKSVDHEVSHSYKKIIEWEDHLKPYIIKEEERKNFDINEYGYTLIKKFKNVGDELAFRDMIEGYERYLVPRYFLSSLLLVNKNNFKIVKVDRNDTINTIVYKLLKTDFSFEEGDV